MMTKQRDAQEAALDTLKKLRAQGHIALLAGGCVRDRLLGRAPKDYDVVTDATPARVKEVFPRARHVGVQFGVMLVRRWGFEIEVATFRSDGPYSDGRHPDEIRFGSAEEDARRRDFTINGLFFDPIEETVIDYVDGRSDLSAGVVRTIGAPELRFAEDHLRMLRAVRFAARLGFDIERGTFEAIAGLADRLRSVSTERVWMELEMILVDASRVRGWSLLVETGLRGHLAEVWPADEADDRRVCDRLGVLRAERVEPALALAVALKGRTLEAARKICRGLRLSNRLIKTVVWILQSLPALQRDDALDLADLKMLMAADAWDLLMELLRCDLTASRGDLAIHQRLEARSATIPPEKVAPSPFLTGDDLGAMGLTPGPRLGKILDAVYRAQLNETISSKRDARKLAETMLSE